MSDDKYCDFCRSTLDPKWENDGHEDWCPIVEIERLRAALVEIAHHSRASSAVIKIAREALGE